jgi:hypothetical protein
MAQDKTAEVSEAEIAVHWQEEDYVSPPEKFVAQANLADNTVFERFRLDNFPDCFKEYADLLDWYKIWDVTLDTSNPPFWRWFVGARINASYNCVDRHLAKHKNKTAIHFVPEPEHEAIQHVTYQELYVRVNEVAALLRDFCGLKEGDRVTLHMPMVAELPITMLACARLGVIDSQVFSGFSGKATADRIVDSESRVLITMDAYYRGGQLLDHKEKADVAVDEARKEGVQVEKVLMWQRHPDRHSSPTRLVEGRDFVMNEVLSDYRRRGINPVEMPAEDPLFLMYTSGTTGKPKGCQHSTGGYLSYVGGTSKYIQDIHPEDVYWCMADIGWITGHSYIVYGPLALAASSVVYEGLPTYPDAGRPWRIAEELDVNIFHTSPTAIRALRRAGERGGACRLEHRCPHFRRPRPAGRAGHGDRGPGGLRGEVRRLPWRAGRGGPDVRHHGRRDRLVHDRRARPHARQHVSLRADPVRLHPPHHADGRAAEPHQRRGLRGLGLHPPSERPDRRGRRPRRHDHAGDRDAQPRWLHPGRPPGHPGGALPQRLRNADHLRSGRVGARGHGALGALEPVCDELYPAEQARILRLLIERIDVAPDGISIALHSAGIRSLVAELAGQEAPARAASEPLLEAAE